MAVAFDNSTGSALNNVTTPQTTTLNVGAGSNRALVVAIATEVGTVTSATWDSGGTNQAMTLITNTSIAGTGCILSMWGLVAPTSGNLTLSYAWTGGLTDIVIGLVSFTGVNQTGGSTSFPNGTTASGTSSTGSVTVTSATDNAIVAINVNAGAGGVNSVSNTQIVINNANNLNCGSNWSAGSASHAMTAALSASAAWISAGTDVAAPAAATVLLGQALL